MQPNIKLHFATSLIIFISSIAASYFTHVVWWSFGGLLFYISSHIPKDSEAGSVLSYFILGFGAFMYALAFARMGWSC